jgi:DNA-directed RNA polymerase specialized sigma24 family protein
MQRAAETTIVEVATIRVRWRVKSLVRSGAIARQDATEVVQDALARLVERGLSPVDPPSWGQVYNAVRSSLDCAPVGHPDPHGSWRLDVTRRGKALDAEVADLLAGLTAGDDPGDLAEPDNRHDMLAAAIVRRGTSFDIELFQLLGGGRSARAAAAMLGCHHVTVWRRLQDWRKWVL